MMILARWFLVFGLIPICAIAQSPDNAISSGAKSVCLARISAAPVIDGVLDDAVWKSATRIDDFHQYQPGDHGKPSEKTEVYLLYDKDNFYVGARAYDSEPESISARQLVQNGSLQFEDGIGFLLDPFATRRTGYWFKVNPNGIRHDGLYESPTSINRDWDGIWQAEARRDDQGWTAEIAIPFKTINFDPKITKWGFTVNRSIARNSEKVAWTSFDRQINPGSAGYVDCIADIQQGVGLDVVPSLTANRTRDFSLDVSDSKLEPSLDIYYKVTPSLTGLLTFNTDFSATEVDDRQVNLTQFSLFFPEKRQFFNQDSDIFKFAAIRRNGTPFFSRRIGLSGDGEPVDLIAGAKMTGRIGRWNIGVLNVLQDEVVDVDQSSLFVGRIAANILEESSIGMIATHGDPGSNLDNYLVGADFRYRSTRLIADRTIEGSLWYQHTDTEGSSDDQDAYGFKLAYPNRQGWFADLSAMVLEDNYNPALGFANRTGIQEWRAEVAYGFRPQDHWLRLIRPTLLVRDINDIDGRLLSRLQVIKPGEFETRYGDKGELRFRHHEEILDVPFEISDGVIIPAGRYSWNRVQMIIATARERRIGVTIDIDSGDFYGGEHSGLTGDIDWRPNPHIFASVGYAYNDIDLPEGSFETRIIRTRLDVAFNSKWSWVNRVQYDNVSDTMGLNSRLHYNRQAGQDLYFVYNSIFDVDETTRRINTRSTEAIVNISYVFRF